MVELAARPRATVSLDRLNRAAADHPADFHAVDWSTPIDHALPFICPTLTPLYYCPIFSTFSAAQQLRYNQIAALSHNEIITFFETSLAGTVLTALARRRSAPEHLRRALAGFLREENGHTEIFRRLNRLAEPRWYAQTHNHVMRFSAPLRLFTRLLGAHPHGFSAILWVMLAMEEHSLEISRRYLRSKIPLEPHFAAVYRAHLEDETRHVQIDRHLIDLVYATRSALSRSLNARLFMSAVRRFLLVPKRGAMNVLACLAVEFPELRNRLPACRRQLAALARNMDYQRMMYSPESTPQTFEIMSRFPEFAPMRGIMRCYPGAPATDRRQAPPAAEEVP